MNKKEELKSKLVEIQTDSINLIKETVLKGKKSNFLNVDEGIKTSLGIINRVEVDSAGVYVSLNNSPRKLDLLPIEVIVKVAVYL